MTNQIINICMQFTDVVNLPSNHTFRTMETFSQLKFTYTYVLLFKIKIVIWRYSKQILQSTMFEVFTALLFSCPELPSKKKKR